MACNELYLGNFGIPLDYVVKDCDGNAVDLSDVSDKGYEIIKPDGTQIEESVGFVTDGTDGALRFLIADGFLDQTGLWRYRAFYEIGLNGRYHTEWLEFVVRPLSESRINAEWGSANANCYVTLAEANDFILNSVVDHDDWKAASSQTREAALLEATRDIDSYSWMGCRYYHDQALQFPRETDNTWPWNRASGPLLSTAEQTRQRRAVEQACCYQALKLVRDAGKNQHQERIANGVKFYSEKIGEAQQSFAYQAGSFIQRLSPEALAVLTPYRSQKRVLRG